MKIQITLSILLALALLGGCKSSTTVSDDDLGTLRGKVALSDVLCNPVTNDSGATIHIEGTGFSTTTNPTGEWEIDNVPAGIYNIIITKPGFDTDLIAQDQFSGAGTQFLENGAITEMLLDSVPVVSIQVTRKDSIQPIFNLDSLAHHDTILYGEDTVAIEYFLNITFTMHGPDSAITFGTDLTDITHPSNGVDFPQGNSTILRNANINLSGTFLSYSHQSPQPGDSIIITTTPSSCGGGNGPKLSKAFVLP